MSSLVCFFINHYKTIIKPCVPLNTVLAVGEFEFAMIKHYVVLFVKKEDKLKGP